MLTAAQHLMRGGGARLAAASGADLAQLSWGMAKANMWLPELQEAVDQVSTCFRGVAAHAGSLASVFDQCLTGVEKSRVTQGA